MTTLEIAFRNIFRNRRRSLMTLMTICIGAVATLIFAGFMNYMLLGYQTVTVERTGHLAISQNGYFDFGAGNPTAYSIRKYKDIVRLVENDPVLRPMTAVVTPTLSLVGIAGNYSADASKTFFGQGVVPADGDHMRQWNEYGLGVDGRFNKQRYLLANDDIDGGVVGTGLARILRLCEPLHIDGCPSPPKEKKNRPAMDIASVAPEDFTSLVAEIAPPPQDNSAEELHIDLLAATSGGTPNVVSLTVKGADYMGIKEVDDNFILMNLERAQQLLYGRNEHEVTSIVVQLHKTEDLPQAHAQLVSLFKTHGLDLEVHDFTDLVSQYKQVEGMYQFIFLFISMIMVIIVLFTVVNTMSMSVMERTAEIGTLRALGVQRGGIRRQFVAEGWVLGVIGATAGVALASGITIAINHASFTFTPPGVVRPIPFSLYLFGDSGIILKTWLSLTVVAAIAAFVPAHRAAKMPVVDALRHV